MGDNTLMHFGIKGMKWGVRRTEEQLARARGETKTDSKTEKPKNNIGKAFNQNIKVGKDKSPISAAEKITKESEKVIDNSIKLSNAISKARGKNDKSSINELTNEELNAAITRMRLEDTYNELSQKRIDRGKTSVTEVLSMAGNVVGIAGGIVGIAATVKTLKG